MTNTDKIIEAFLDVLDGNDAHAIQGDTGLAFERCLEICQLRNELTAARNRHPDGWNRGPIPYENGTVVLIVLAAESHPELEHLGDPISVRCWGEKLRTTSGAHPIYPNRNEIIKWRDI